MEAWYEQQISPSCLQCGAEGHWAAKCRSKEACLEGTQIMATSSGRRENRAEESGPDCEAGAELGRGKKRDGSGRMFDLRDNWKEVTASIKKRGEGASWQLTADWMNRDDGEPAARSKLRSSKCQTGAEKNSQKRGTFQVEATKSKGEKSKRDKAEVLVTVSEAVQLAKSQPAAEEGAKVDAQRVQQTFATRLSRSNSAERSTTQELVRVVKDSEESQKCVLREQRGGERRTETGKALEMPEAEVKETVKVKLTEQQPEEIKPQEEIKRSAEMAEVPKLEAEMASEQSNGKPYGEKSKDPEIPDGEIRAAGKPELSEQQSEELQSQESLKRLTMERRDDFSV